MIRDTLCGGKGKEDILVWEDSSDLSSRLGSLGACPGSVPLVGPIPGACPLIIPHRVSIGPGLGGGGWRQVVSISRWARMAGLSASTLIPLCTNNILHFLHALFPSGTLVPCSFV